MKPFISFFLVATMVFALVGCQSTKEQNLEFTHDSKDVEVQNIPYEVQYIRTNGYQEGAKFPRVQLINHLTDISDYYALNRELFDLERKEQVYTDTTIGFLDACDRYEEAFFADHYLIFVLLEEGSGSVRHEVTAVQQTGEKLSIYIDRKVPECGTDDMAQWHIILELGRENAAQSIGDVQVYLDKKLAYDGGPFTEPIAPLESKSPPIGTVITPTGEATMIPAGRTWTYKNLDGTMTTICADQAMRPLDREFVNPITIDEKYADEKGYPVKLVWEQTPSKVICTCWPDTVWEDASIWQSGSATGEQIPFDLNQPFYAKAGGYLYEFAATWNDTGTGSYGTANYYVYIQGGIHTHQLAQSPQAVDDPEIGYCGNTWTTIHIDGEDYSFMAGHSVTLTDILTNLDYDPNKVCRCKPEFTVDTEFGTGYGIHLANSYARCEKGQADLTQAQIDTITQIVQWAKDTNATYLE